MNSVFQQQIYIGTQVVSKSKYGNENTEILSKYMTAFIFIVTIFFIASPRE